MFNSEKVQPECKVIVGSEFNEFCVNQEVFCLLSGESDGETGGPLGDGRFRPSAPAGLHAQFRRLFLVEPLQRFTTSQVVG